MELVPITKHEALGNDFLVWLDTAGGEVPTAAQAISWCDRHFGIGADGLLVGTDIDADIVDMALFNSDGSQAEISGNGIRCFAQALAMGGHLSGPTVRVRSGGDIRDLHVADTAEKHVHTVTVAMGTVHAFDVDQDAVTAAAQREIRAVLAGSIGNPHVVVVLDKLDDLDPCVAGPRVETLFPGGMNVHFAETLDAHSVELRIWERGAGVTLACGSGATVAAHRLVAQSLLKGPEVKVTMPGGAATVRVCGSEAELRGPTRLIARCQVT